RPPRSPLFPHTTLFRSARAWSEPLVADSVWLRCSPSVEVTEIEHVAMKFEMLAFAMAARLADRMEFVSYWRRLAPANCQQKEFDLLYALALSPPSLAESFS